MPLNYMHGYIIGVTAVKATVKLVAMRYLVKIFNMLPLLAVAV